MAKCQKIPSCWPLQGEIPAEATPASPAPHDPRGEKRKSTFFSSTPPKTELKGKQRSPAVRYGLYVLRFSVRS